MSTARVRPIGDFVACLFGPLVWAAHLFVAYATEALGCGPVPASPRQMVWIITIATLVALAALAGFLAWQFRARPRRADEESLFLRQLSIGLALLAMLAVIWGGAHAPLLTPCLPAAG